MKKKTKKIDKMLAAVALASAKNNINSTCAWFLYQPKVPDSVKELRRF